eukprot:7045198-Alexandrium_andersonii.AAC.1
MHAWAPGRAGSKKGVTPYATKSWTLPMTTCCQVRASLAPCVHCRRSDVGALCKQMPLKAWACSGPEVLS